MVQLQLLDGKKAYWRTTDYVSGLMAADMLKVRPKD